MVDIGHHAPCLEGMGRQVSEILADPVAQGFGFAHVNDGTVLIMHQIDTRQLRQTVRLFL